MIKKYALLFTITLCSFALIACGSNDSNLNDSTNPAADTHSSISGNVVKGPVEGAEIRLYYFGADGTETGIAAGNAPVVTNAAGGFEFHIDPQSLDNIHAPLVLRTTGGTMGGQPAPELGSVISDTTDLQVAGRMMTQHLSTASSVAARMLKGRALTAKSPPSVANADDCINKVEGALEVDLKQDPVDTTQGVAMVNISVDQNLDLFNTPENSAAIQEYIDYLAKNLNSSSGALDGEMEDPDNPGQDKPAGFDGIGDGHLARICPNGPIEFHHLMVKVDKTSIVDDGADAVSIDLKMTNGWGPEEDGIRIDMSIITGQGSLSDTAPEIQRGSAQVAFTSTTPGEVTIQAGYILGNGNTISHQIAIEVLDANENTAPIAHAGSDQTVSTGSVVTLNGNQSSDPNNDPLTYAWSLTSTPAGSSATLTDATVFNPTFTADVDGEYIAQLVVNDGTIDSLPASVTITSASVNSAPTADAGQNQNVKTGDEVTLDGSGSQDPDDDPLTYQWELTSIPAGSSASLSDAGQSSPSFTADLDGEYVAVLVVNDGNEDSAQASVTITASSANSAPTANAGPDQNVTTNEQVEIDGTGSSDADDDALTYAWTLVSKPSGSATDLPDPATTEMVYITPDVAGDYVIQLVVNDGTVDSAADTVAITATPDGAALFAANCSGGGCHGTDGGGQGNRNIIGKSFDDIKGVLTGPSPHMGLTIDDVEGDDGARAIADFLNQ